MNLLLVTEEDFLAENRVVIRGERLRHLRKVLRTKVGDEVRAGVLGGRIGRARIVAIDASEAEAEIAVDEGPPAPSEVALVLALPRPKFLGRILQSVTSLGLKSIVLLQTDRVEKSYWQSSVLQTARLRRHLLLGLAQGRDTVLPAVELETSFDSFVEKTLPPRLARAPGLLAHPDAEAPFPSPVEGPVTLIVGPEGGLLDFEIEALCRAGAEAFTLGHRLLTVETAVSVLLGRLMVS